jgi:DNA-binding MarR family transcriptional regulator
MRVYDQAARLEALMPQVMGVLFRSEEEDPLRNHSIAQIRLMRALMSGSKTASELSHNLNLSPSSLTQMASRMILAGLVSKELDLHDRRVRKLSLTEGGRALMEGRQSMRSRAAARMLERIEPPKREKLLGLMEEIVALDPPVGNSLLEAAV